MKSEIRTILLGIGQFLFCALLSASAYGLYVLNLRVSVPVESLIELGQEALLLSAAIITLRTASLEKALSGGLWLVGGFLVALFIRELDGWIGHAWVYCELVWLCGVAWAVKAAGLGTVIPGLAHFIGHRAFPIMCAGVAILLVYSRLYGMQTLWLAYALGPLFGEDPLGRIHRTSRLHDDLHERRLLCRQLPAHAPPQGPRRTPTEGSRHQDRLTRPQPAKRKGPKS